MSKPKYCIYLRVSTRKQGDSGLGLDAQRKMCTDVIEREGGELVREFQDVESGKSRTRPGLWASIEYCKEQKCTLVIAKLDRLARDVEFTFKVMGSGIQIRFADMPVVNTMILGVFATVAQYERELIASRTKGALGSIKRNIAQNGGHVSKSGNYIKHLGRAKGCDTSVAVAAAGLSHTRGATAWREDSALYSWVINQVIRGRKQKDILEEAVKLYETNPGRYSTRNGKALCQGTLSRWVKEIRI